MGNTISPYTVIDVTPTLSTNEYAAGDALFNKVEIPNAVLGNGGASKLIAVNINSKKATASSLIVYVFTNNQSLESANDPFDVSAADGASAGFLGVLDFQGGKNDLGNFNVCQVPDTDEDGSPLPIILQAAADSTSVYFVCIVSGAVVTYADGDLTFRFHIQYR